MGGSVVFVGICFVVFVPLETLMMVPAVTGVGRLLCVGLQPVGFGAFGVVRGKPCFSSQPAELARFANLSAPPLMTFH